MMDRPATVKVACPKCQSGNLTIVESATWLTEWDVNGGRFDRGEGYANPASIDRVDVRCKDCGHGWKPRKAWQVDDICEEDGGEQ